MEDHCGTAKPEEAKQSTGEKERGPQHPKTMNQGEHWHTRSRMNKANKMQAVAQLPGTQDLEIN